MHKRLGSMVGRLVDELADGRGDLEEIGDVGSRVVRRHIDLWGKGNRPCRR